MSFSILSLPGIDSVSRIQKKWSWTGTLAVKLENEWDSLCSVEITDSICRVRDGMPFSVMGDMDDLRFESLHEFVDVETVLKACRPATQLARLIPQKNQNKNKLREFTGLVCYMEYYKRVGNLFSFRTFPRHRQVAFVPVSLNGNVIGQMLFFPPSLLELVKLLDIPPDLKNSLLIVALFPWALTLQEIEESKELLPPTEPVDFNVDGLDEKDQSLFAKTVRKPSLNLQAQHAIRILSVSLNTVPSLRLRIIYSGQCLFINT